MNVAEIHPVRNRRDDVFQRHERLQIVVDVNADDTTEVLLVVVGHERLLAEERSRLLVVIREQNLSKYRRFAFEW